MPGLLILAMVGITVRTMVYLLSSNDFIYIVGPIMRTTLSGLVFGAPVVAGRPSLALLLTLPVSVFVSRPRCRHGRPPAPGWW